MRFFNTQGCLLPLLLAQDAVARTLLAKRQSLSGGALDTSFENITCSTETINQAGADPADRWAAARADLAWQQIARNWNEVPGAGGTSISLNFVGSAFNLWGFGDAPNRGLVDDGCDFSSLECGDHTTPGTHIPTPGAWLIAKSIYHIHSYWLNVYDAMDAAKGDLANSMSDYVNTFAPGKPEENLVDKIFDGLTEAIFNAILSEVLGPGLEKLLSNLGEKAAGAITDHVVDSAKDMVSEGLASGELPTQADKRNTLVGTLQTIVDSQKNTLSTYITNLLAGRVDTLSNLHDQISDGHWVVDQLQQSGSDLFSLSTATTGAFAALLAPAAWELNQLQPILLVEQKQCDGGEPLSIMDSDATHAGGSCIIDDVTLFLVGFDNHQCQTNSFPGGVPHTDNVPCTEGVFKKLPGIDQTQAFGFDKDGIVLSVYNQWLLNGQQNNAQFSPNSTITDGSGNDGPYPLSAGINTPGLFPSIPVCDINTVSDRWFNSGGSIRGAASLCS